MSTALWNEMSDLKRRSEVTEDIQEKMRRQIKDLTERLAALEANKRDTLHVRAK